MLIDVFVEPSPKPCVHMIGPRRDTCADHSIKSCKLTCAGTGTDGKAGTVRHNVEGANGPVLARPIDAVEQLLFGGYEIELARSIGTAVMRPVGKVVTFLECSIHHLLFIFVVQVDIAEIKGFIVFT